MSRRAAAAVVLTAFLAVVAGSSSAPASGPSPWDHDADLDLVASANPSAAQPVVADDVFDVSSAFRRSVTARVTATGSAICDGCDATGTALQVVYVNGGRQAGLDNTAVAWSQDCTDCAATALSVQVVVLRGVPALVPNNRALAANAACTSCRADSAAYQLVVSSARRSDRLSYSALAELRAWVADQAAAMRATPAPAAARTSRAAQKHAQRVAESDLGTLEDLVTADLGADTVAADVDLSD